MISRRLRTLSIFILISSCGNNQNLFGINALTSLARNDPFPVFTSLDPQTLLLTHEKLFFRDPQWSELKKNNFSISLSPFGQAANISRPLYSLPTTQFVDCGTPQISLVSRYPTGNKLQLGDVPCGPWNTLAMLYGPIPEGQMLAPALLDALNALFPNVAPGTLDDPSFIDPDRLLGFVTFPGQYRKRGVRFELEANFIAGFGLTMQTGVASIRLTTTHQDLTCLAQQSCDYFPTNLYTASEFQLFQDKTQKYLSKNLKTIVPEIGQCFEDFCGVSIDEIRLNLWWRHMFELNRNQDREEWAQILMTPFFCLGGSFSPGKIAPATELFRVPFGNDGHSSVGFNTGLMFDFIETIEIGAEVGVTHFFPRDICNYPVPTHPCQCRLYPFRTDVCISPGLNWFFGAKISAYHFLDKLSMYFEYIMMEHKMDRIKLNCPDPAFLPEVLEAMSSWKAKFGNIGFTYDISPNIALGFFWQTPISERGAYKSTTIMGTFNATF